MMDATFHPTGIVFFSMSGHSRRLASKLATALDAELIALQAPEYTPGVLGYLRAGFNSLRQKCDLAPQSFTSLAGFDCIVVCGPVWTSYPATPLRGLLRADIGLPDTVALFLTSGNQSSAEKAFGTAARDLGRPLAATAALANAAEGTAQEDRCIAHFVDALQGPGALAAST